MANLPKPPRDQMKINKQRILDYVKGYIHRNGTSPTIREITAAIGYKATSFGTVQVYVQELIDEGFLKRRIKGARSIQVVNPPPRAWYYRREDSMKAVVRANGEIPTE